MNNLITLPSQMLHRIFFFCVVFVLPSSAIAQDFKEALLKMKALYAGAPRLHVIMSVKAFDSASPSTLFYDQKAEVKKEAENYFYNFDGVEMLLNENYLLMLNHKQKQILYTKKNAMPSGQFKNSFQFNLDSILSVYGKYSYVDTKNGMNHFRITHKKGASIKQTEMYFTVDSGKISRIEYLYPSGQQVTIQFELLDKEPSFETMAFSEREYIIVNDTQVLPVPKWNNYKLVNGEESIAGANRKMRSGN